MSLKYIIEFNVYTDGDWGYGEDMIDNSYVSRFIRNDLFEYTNIDPNNYSSKFRRVFNTKEDLINFIEKLSASVHGNVHWTEVMHDFFQKATDAVISYAKTQPKTIFSDFIDSNTTAEIHVYTIEYTDPREKGARLVSAMTLDPGPFEKIITSLYPDAKVDIDYSMDGLTVILNDNEIPDAIDMYSRLAEYFGVKSVTYIHLDMTYDAEIWISYIE